MFFIRSARHDLTLDLLLLVFPPPLALAPLIVGLLSDVSGVQFSLKEKAAHISFICSCQRHFVTSASRIHLVGKSPFPKPYLLRVLYTIVLFVESISGPFILFYFRR